MKKSRLKYHSVHVYQFSNKPKKSLFGNYVPPWYLKILESESSINKIKHPRPNTKKKKKKKITLKSVSQLASLIHRYAKIPVPWGLKAYPSTGLSILLGGWISKPRETLGTYMENRKASVSLYPWMIVSLWDSLKQEYCHQSLKYSQMVSLIYSNGDDEVETEGVAKSV